MSSSFLSVNSNTASSIILMGSMETSGTMAEMFIRFIVIITIIFNNSQSRTMNVALLVYWLRHIVRKHRPRSPASAEET